ncbi:hypothetical protein ACFSSA_07755 [Luteolibacter algae]|uniref:DUF3108 domain-containing protein n=1 Tax=Luteolibacter algae TaxID=454151 RepID=A0ABW5DAB9_9BACT
MFRSLTILSLGLVMTLNAGVTRTWSNTDGTKSFSAEFISRQNNTVTLKREGSSEPLTFDISKLNAEDQRWLNLNYPLGENGKGEAMPDASAVFDTLKFGDTRETVTNKLMASKMVDSKVQGIFVGRTGLNGIYHTRQKVGGLYCFLFFDWTTDGELTEITLQTETKSDAEYDTVLQPCWEEMAELIGQIHGKPHQHMNIPGADLLTEGSMLASHLWPLEQGGTVMLGTSKINNGYQVVVRFTKEVINAKVIP